ncbi:bifunctional enoyl-CoA hydratase/phosphate acetyltransferase [Iodobacter ciconiae]|uniref:Bifunctional enoyl-CoA hydratase/phosphate acetyltransferase n=1 Tax=Iodobacter ciconiae TaxID=2496266 RepID=A0A3S8ZVZ1_9NEIS|nr:bifunctional enoyl-CoA hydratase/phosphate acetyltransferase [Iodobacter ciconiae]AZN37642.1 bifunctional enoyl-CoA hydratase/phosphate acetyltransferase [Iodobacter ciconiae]
MITLQNRCFDEIEIGDCARIQHTLSIRDIQLFATVAGDFNPTHLEAAFANQAGFSGATAPGMWLGAQISGILGSQLPGPGTVYVGQNLQFHSAAILGDTLDISVTVREKHPEEHIISFDCLCLNQHGQTIMSGVAKVVAPTKKITLARPDAGLVSVQTHNAFELLLERCNKLPPFSAAIAHPCDESSLKVAIAAKAQGMMQPILVGPRNKIITIAEQYNLDITGLRIEDVPHSHAAANRAVELVTSGEALILMKGSLHTDELMSAVVKSSLRTERRISHVFIMDVPTYHKTLLVTDAAINIYPDLQDKLDICQNAIDLAHTLGIPKPKVAVLSAVETINPKILSTLEAASLCKMSDRGQITGAILDGPLALDNAISYESARIKKIESSVAGDADILLVPDLEAGNILAKQLTFMSNADAAGIVLGARVPIILTSRADNERTKLASCAIACIMADARTK